MARLFAFAFVSLLLNQAAAQDVVRPQTDTVISATAFGDWDKAETVEVRTGRDLELERDLVVEVGRMLADAGYQVVPKGQIVLTVSSTSPVPGIEARDAVTIDDRIRTMDMTRNDRAVLVPYEQRKGEPGPLFLLCACRPTGPANPTCGWPRRPRRTTAADGSPHLYGWLRHWSTGSGSPWPPMLQRGNNPPVSSVTVLSSDKSGRSL